MSHGVPITRRRGEASPEMHKPVLVLCCTGQPGADGSGSGGCLKQQQIPLLGQLHQA